MDTISIWQLVLTVAGGVALAVTIPLIGFALAFRPWIQSTIKGELADFRVQITSEMQEVTSRLSKLEPFERSAAQQANLGLRDKPNPPVSRKNELLDKWQNQTLDYVESLELKIILEQEAKEANSAVKALIIIALIGLGLYILTRKS